jgi:hypothetical protein
MPMVNIELPPDMKDLEKYDDVKSLMNQSTDGIVPLTEKI